MVLSRNNCFFVPRVLVPNCWVSKNAKTPEIDKKVLQSCFCGKEETAHIRKRIRRKVKVTKNVILSEIMPTNGERYRSDIFC